MRRKSWIVGLALFFYAIAERTVEAACSCPDLTGLQKAAGFVTFMNIMWILAIGIGCLSIAVIAIHWGNKLLELLVEIPLVVYEVLFYLSGVGTIASGIFLSVSVAPFVGFTGCLLLLAAFAFTIHLREPEVENWTVALGFAAAWSGAAVLYMSPMIAWIAVLALFASLGFTAAVIPGLGYAMGFKDEDSVSRGTASAFCILIVFGIMRMMGGIIPVAHIFEPAALFIGSFVGYLGLLIYSSRWYSGKHDYALAQVVTIMAGIFALFVGSVWQIGELQKIGGTFFMLYVIEKIFEIPVEKKTSYAYLGLLVSGMTYGSIMYLRLHPVMQSYFFQF